MLVLFILDVNLLFNFYFCVCVFECMFYSLNFKMASNFTPEEDKPMHPAGLDMKRESLRDILDGNEVNVSTALLSGYTPITIKAEPSICAAGYNKSIY